MLEFPRIWRRHQITRHSLKIHLTNAQLLRVKSKTILETTSINLQQIIIAL